MKTRRWVRLLAAGLVAALALGGCGRSATNNEQTSNRNYDLYIYNGKPQIADQLEELCSIYEQETGVRIKTLTLDEPDALRTEMNSSAPPAILTTYTDTMIEWQEGGFLLDFKDAQTEAFRQLAETVPQDMRLSTDGSNSYGIPYSIEGYGLVVDTDMLADLFGADGNAVAKDLQLASYEEFEAMVKAVDAYVNQGQAAQITLNGTAYQLQAEKQGLAKNLLGVFAVAGSETWTYGDHLVNAAICSVFNNVVDANLVSREDVDKLDSPMQRYAQLLDLMTSYAVSKDGKISRGGDFVSSTINGYDQSVQNFASGKALFLQQGNWAYNDLVSANADLADSLTFVPLKFPYQEGDVTAEGKTVEQLNSSIPVFAPCYYSINTQVSKEEQKLAEEFLVWMNTSETGRDFIENKFSFIPYDAGEDAVASNSLNASILEYKAEGNVLSNPYTGAPPTWASKVMGNMMLEEYLCREGSWTQEDYQHIAQEAVKGWKNLMDLY